MDTRERFIQHLTTGYLATGDYIVLDAAMLKGIPIPEDLLFGEPFFDVIDLPRKDVQGCGMVNFIRLEDTQDRPKLFSTFMLNMLPSWKKKC